MEKKGLPSVFVRSKRPWINMQGTSSEEITKVIDLCPSGALSYRRICDKEKKMEPSAQIKAIRNGPSAHPGRLCSYWCREGKVLKDKGPYALC